MTTSFALLAIILVAAGFMAVQFAPRSNAPSVVKPSPVALDYGPPPPRVQLLWVQDPNHPGWLIGFDWTGKPRGTVKLSQRIDQFARLSQAPDGSVFAYSPNGKGGFQVFFDRVGNPIPGQDSPVFYQSEMWADDSRHLCTLDYGGRHWSLGLQLPGAAPNPVNVVALDPAFVQSGIIAVSFAACSARNDRAVIAYSYSGRPTEYSDVRISDGAILQQRAYAAYQLANVTASPGGSFLAENSGKSSGQVAPAAPSTVIRRASDLAVVLRIDASIGVLGFNSDDSLALVTLTPWVTGVPTQLAVIDARSGDVVWRSGGSEEFAGFLPEPDGSDLAVMSQAPGDSSLHPSVSVVIVNGQGRATDLPGRYFGL